MCRRTFLQHSTALPVPACQMKGQQLSRAKPKCLSTHVPVFRTAAGWVWSNVSLCMRVPSLPEQCHVHSCPGHQRDLHRQPASNTWCCERVVHIPNVKATAQYTVVASKRGSAARLRHRPLASCADEHATLLPQDHNLMRCDHIIWCILQLQMPAAAVTDSSSRVEPNPTHFAWQLPGPSPPWSP